MRHSHPLPLLLALLVLAACGEDQPPTAPTPPAAPSGPAYSHTAGHKVVNSLADPGNGVCNATQCTLREAINDPQSTEISFKPGISGPITLARPGLGGGTLVIEKTLTITGPSGGIIIQRRSTDPAFGIVRVGAGVSVKLTNLTLRNGKTGGPGAGLINLGRLALTTCTVAANSGSGIDNRSHLVLTNSRVSNNLGGGIGNDGNLTLTNSRVSDNSGVGIGNSGALTLTNSVVTNNSNPSGFGGGISSSHGGLTLAHSLVMGNSALEGGGIYSLGGRATIANSLITDNSASNGGGGIWNQKGTVTLTTSTVARNSGGPGGGGVVSIGVFTIIKSTIAGNSASQGAGGGIANFEGGTFTLRNSTVSGNLAVRGGGIFSEGFDFNANFTITSSTVARNRATQTGGGIQQSFASLLALTNSLVAQNSAPTGPDVLHVDTEHPVLARFSLIGNRSGSGITNANGNQVGTASAPIDPRLGALADNGGPTRTHALLLGSPAIDAASTPDCPTTDQRGVLRPQGAACDIGSYERK